MDLLESGAAKRGANRHLVAAPAGSAERHAAEVLTSAGHSDLAGALDIATELVDTATTLTGSDP